MGYGKTTAARHLMASPDFSCVYLSVPQGADSARWLWEYFCPRLTDEAEKNNRETLLVSTLKNLGFPDDSAAVQRALDVMFQ